ncbi:MAG: nucleotide pyrophosphohydrolase [Desulfobulbus propionicus]|nr:MAG: nucleotide pyrophosphohydrolase [Desulfobulbus propionicus]
MESDRYLDVEQLARALREFARIRNWEPLHSPKNLASALIVEAAELLEHFQWLEPKDSLHLDPATKQAVAYEMADVFIYLTRMADRLDIDLLAVAKEKMALNARKYPPPEV